MKVQVIILFVWLNECGCSHRFKKVINGVPLNGRPTTYSAIRYYGALASTGNIIWNYIGYWDYVKPTDVWCSGSLLTPGILQTACHCIADFDKNNFRHLKPPFVRHSWEGQAIVYVGVSNRFGDEGSMEKYNYIITVRFTVHSKCASFGKSDIAQYDYGIVQLDAEWVTHSDAPPTYPWTEIDFAPHYTEKDLKQFYQYALRKLLVCLLIGFGQYTRNIDAPISDVLRTGWGILLSRDECIKETSYVLARNQSLHQHFNWVCTRGFPNHDQEAGPGDSGGPFTCDNKHFGVLSGFQYLLDRNGNRVNIITKHHPLVHTLFSNAIDYRKSFIHSLEDRPLYIDRRLSDQAHDIHWKSHSSLQRSSMALLQLR